MVMVMVDMMVDVMVDGGCGMRNALRDAMDGQ